MSVIKKREIVLSPLHIVLSLTPIPEAPKYMEYEDRLTPFLRKPGRLKLLPDQVLPVEPNEEYEPVPTEASTIDNNSVNEENGKNSDEPPFVKEEKELKGFEKWELKSRLQNLRIAKELFAKCIVSYDS